jgi:hypothetical protein
MAAAHEKPQYRPLRGLFSLVSCHIPQESCLKAILMALLVSFSLTGCITVAVPADHQAKRCEISTDRMTLKIIDLAKATNSYYTTEGYLVSPILVPTTAMISGAYVLVHNTYFYGKEKIVCG